MRVTLPSATGRYVVGQGGNHEAGTASQEPNADGGMISRPATGFGKQRPSAKKLRIWACFTCRPIEARVKLLWKSVSKTASHSWRPSGVNPSAKPATGCFEIRAGRVGSMPRPTHLQSWPNRGDANPNNTPTASFCGIFNSSPPTSFRHQSPLPSDRCLCARQGVSRYTSMSNTKGNSGVGKNVSSPVFRSRRVIPLR